MNCAETCISSLDKSQFALPISTHYGPSSIVPRSPFHPCSACIVAQLVTQDIGHASQHASVVARARCRHAMHVLRHDGVYYISPSPLPMYCTASVHRTRSQFLCLRYAHQHLLHLWRSLHPFLFKDVVCLVLDQLKYRDYQTPRVGLSNHESFHKYAY